MLAEARWTTRCLRGLKPFARLARTLKRVPEVMVKITSSCKGMRQIGKHIDYISRKGELELEDQDGFLLKGRSELQDLKSDWRINGPEEIGPTSERRDTFNIVFPCRRIPTRSA